jgi:hypothetical protein
MGTNSRNTKWCASVCATPQSGVESPHTQSGRMLDDRPAAYASEVICHVNKGDGTEINEVFISCEKDASQGAFRQGRMQERRK